MANFLFWLSLIIILYTYVGYLIILIILYYIKKFFKRNNENKAAYEPTVTVFIAAYNEREIIKQKVENLRQLDYNPNKISFVWVTDGSTDGTEKLLLQYPDMIVLHEPERKGKTGAINRGMKYVTSEIVIFCDANNLLSSNSVKAIVEKFKEPLTGCVAGEKRISVPQKDIANVAGEGIYWRIESLIKWLESEINSTIGAAGELCAIRTNLFEPLEPDTILDDFILSMRIAIKGYKIKYASEAVAIEAASLSVSDEMKRKIRISAGCIQAIPRLAKLLNIFRYGLLSFQYWSHKIFRWIAVPIAIILLFITNIFLAKVNSFYLFMMIAQLIFYFFVLVGFLLRKKKLKHKFIFFPYYLTIMNLSIVIGFIRYLKGNQSVNWEKAQRIN
jgi:cellulose synthase/poly-beta-1,6-N-acetylglucosamine synthase-like glycosyltransferase